jgi:four helix bundle protein
MQNPENLKVTREAMTLAVLTYRFTDGFPAAERFGLSAQMRRAAVSVGSNIAEGCGRGGNAALSAFLQVAMGSASELGFQIRLSAELKVGLAKDRATLDAQTALVKKMLSRLITALRRRPDRPTPRVPR